ncbi:hypothetical protein CesoFtcFv8_020221 [Champsocephalus esox]|uniref:Uncharacterized protein n=1 Tax=Champsocephalus esox TaxID=159716 RepID=A0AAN8BFP7_9TELE|nr:hypothetical protein CesoFtcFv8_020221 [Champsocephalus esox]
MPRKTSDVNESQRSAGVSAMQGTIHWVCHSNHRSQTQRISVKSFVSRSTRDWNPFVVLLGPVPSRVMEVRVFTLA